MPIKASNQIAEALKMLGVNLPAPAPMPDMQPGMPGYDPTTLANKIDNPSVMDPTWLNLLRTGQNTLERVGQMGKGLITGGAEQPGPSAENLGAILGAIGPLLSKIVYHGSPHVFDKFDMSKIGTGEGAQAYGHGLYFADQPGVAKSYRPSAASVSVGGKPVPTQTVAEQMLEARLAQAYENGHSNPIGSVRAGLSLDRQTLSSEGMKKEYDEALRLLDEWNKSGITENRLGMLADVDLPDDAIAKMLDWDAPLSQQPEAVRKAVHQAMGDVRPVKHRDGTYSATRVQPDGSGKVIWEPVPGDTAEEAMSNYRKWLDDAPGEQIYTHLAQGLDVTPGNTAAAASRMLRERGIPGIRYYDGASRGRAGGELIGVEQKGGKFFAKIRKYGVSGGQGNMPADIFTTSKPYSTEAEARKWAEDAIGGGTRNYVVFDDQLPKIVKVTR